MNEAMKCLRISELVEKLQELQAVYGDAYVGIIDADTDWVLALDEVCFVEHTKVDFDIVPNGIVVVRGEYHTHAPWDNP